MKRYPLLILAFALTGAILASLLIMRHYFPESDFLVSCGSGLYNPCLVLSQSPYASLFGVSVAAYGLLFYLLAALLAFVANFAGGSYLRFSLTLLLPLSALSLLADAVLAGILVKTGYYCTLCIATYGINIAILVLLVLWLRAELPEGYSPIDTVRRYFKKWDTPDKRAACAIIPLSLVLMALTVFFLDGTLQSKGGKTVVSEKEIQEHLADYYQHPVEDVAMPQSGLVLGNPGAKLSLHVFTDPLCPACHQFYKTEKYLLSRFRDRVNIVYHNYPLSTGCNKNVKETKFFNSCAYARVLVAAAVTNRFLPYHLFLLAEYGKNKEATTEGDIREHLLAFFKEQQMSAAAQEAFVAIVNAPETQELIDLDIEAAIRLGLEGTPLIYINGRSMRGVPPVQFLERVIAKELGE